MMEKPYLIDEYPKMHLSIPDFKYRPKKRPGFFGSIASGAPSGGLAYINFGEANCRWNTNGDGGCIKGQIIITLQAEYYFTEEFDFTAQIVEDTIGVGITQLPGTEAWVWDEQDYALTFPENATGSVTICGFASTNALISQTFKTVVAGMPVVKTLSGALIAREHGQRKPATLLKNSYGIKGADCGCITIESSCVCSCSGEAIGYTTQQMATDEVQALTVVDPVAGCTYDWSIVSGGGSLSSSTGTSVNYTAPSENAECAQNPTITLSVGGSMCDSLSIAVNASEDTSVGYDYSNIDTFDTGFTECTQATGTCTGCYISRVKRSHYAYLNCDGTVTPSGWRCGDPDSNTNWTCEYCATDETCPGSCAGQCVYPSNAEIVTNCISTRGAEDGRSAAQKTAGCCPAQLL